MQSILRVLTVSMVILLAAPVQAEEGYYSPNLPSEGQPLNSGYINGWSPADPQVNPGAMQQQQIMQPSAAAVQQAQVMYLYGTDIPGGDMYNVALNTAEQCRSYCVGIPPCRAFTWVAPAVPGLYGMCWIKDAISVQVANNACTSGIVR